MSAQTSENESKDLVLLKTSNNSFEAHFIHDLLITNGIEVILDYKGVGYFSGTMDAPVIAYNIWVNVIDLEDAKTILYSKRDKNEDKQFQQFIAKQKNDAIVLGRVLAIAASLFFLSISFLPIKASDIFMRYVLYGESLFFFLVFVFTFDWSKKKNQ
jgi:hypothetical protein